MKGAGASASQRKRTWPQWQEPSSRMASHLTGGRPEPTPWHAMRMSVRGLDHVRGHMTAPVTAARVGSPAITAAALTFSRRRAFHLPGSTPAGDKAMATRDILRTLKAEHDELRALFEQMEATTDRAAKKRAELLGKI